MLEYTCVAIDSSSAELSLVSIVLDRNFEGAHFC